MAGQIPSFLTGANAKIKVNGVVLAFVTDVSYRVSVGHSSPRVLGRYEVEEHQPLTYDVSGSFTLVRYINAPGITEVNGKGGIADASETKGNGPGSWAAEETAFNSAGARGSFDPGKLHRAISFDIEIYQKTLDGENHAVSRFRNCRINNSEFRISKKTNAIQSFTFVAQYADEDTFVTNESGVGQQYS
jgi:hypothetical protein